MAPFDNPPSSTLLTKISPLVDGQLPDYARDDHPIFSKFLQYYYEYLEAGELTVKSQIDNVLLEVETTSYLLDQDGNQIVYEGSDGKFTVGETITGQTSKATSTILIDDLRNGRMFISAQQQFITGETIVGATSAAEATITRYRGNPVQNIQQLLDYADVDGTIHDFLDQLSVSFMNAIPKNLASGIDKRNLIKNIRELYRTKGTSESFKLFIRILLNLDSEIVYPRKFMMRASDGEWSRSEIIRVAPLLSAVGSELVSQEITGLISGATAIVESVTDLTQGGLNVTEFKIAFRNGDFISGETVRGTSSTRDVLQDFTIYNMVVDTSITDRGILYSKDEEVIINSDYGNASATAEIISVKTGSVSGVVVDDVGAGYKVGDPLVFASSESDISLPTGFVSVVDGSIILDGTDGSSTDAGDFLVYEEATTEHLETFEFALESGLNDEATAITNGSVSNTNIIILDNNVGTITKGMTVYGGGLNEGITVTTVTSQNNITLSRTLILADNTPLRFVDPAGILRLETGTATATDLGHSIISEFLPNPASDTYTTGADQMVLEDATVDLGEIKRIQLTNKGNGFTKLPTITIDPARGTKVLDTQGNYDTPSDAALIAITTDIGAIDEIRVTDGGANYATTDNPDVEPRANFILKDVSGTFVADESLTTHTGVVKTFDDNTQVLQTTIEDVVRTTLETTDALPIGLEDGIASQEDYLTLSGGGTDDGFYNEGLPETGILDEEDGDIIVLNASGLDGDAFIALEDDTGSILRTEPNTFIDKTLIKLEDETGVLLREDAEETTEKIIRRLPQGRRSGSGDFGVYVRALTHKATATALVNGITSTENVTLDNNSGTIDEGMFVTGTIATAAVSGATVNSYDITVTVSSGTIQKGLLVEGTGIPVGTIVASVSTKEIFTLNTQVSLSNSTVLTFKLPSDLTVKTVTSQTQITLNSAITFADDTSLSFESPSTNGPFVNGEEITGGTSGATALILDAAGDLKFISSNDKDFVVGETITGESKVDSGGNTVNAQSIIQTLTNEFVSSPDSIWTSFIIETITNKNAPILEDASSVVVESDLSEEIVLETAGQLRSVITISGHVILDGTDTDSTDAGGFIIGELNGDTIVLEDEDESFITGLDPFRSTFDQYSDQNVQIILDGDFDDTGKILLDGTDTNGSNAGSEIIDESSNADGVASFGNIELEEGGLLLGEIAPETGVLALNGTDSSSTHAGSSVIHEVDGIDFSAGTTTITASGGFTGTIVGADIAKVTASVDAERTDISGYGNVIESILGEDLNRLQDSFFYQQFSYEVQTGAGTNEYLNELKKAVHPSGFAIFGKVSIATPIEEPMTLSALTDGISISAFSGDPDFFRFVRRSLGTVELQSGAQDEVIVLESSVSVSDTEEFFLLEDEGLLLQETTTSYDGATVISNNLILDGTQDGLALQDSRDAGGDILDESGNPIDLENELVTFNRFVFERIDNPVGINHDAIINEDGGLVLSERSGKSGSIQPYGRYPIDLPTEHTSLPTGSSLVRAQTNSDVSLVRSMGITLPTESFGNTANSFGLIRLGERPFGTERTRVETELGTISSTIILEDEDGNIVFDATGTSSEDENFKILTEFSTKDAQEAHRVAIIAVSDILGNEGDLLMEDSDNSIPINQITKIKPVNLNGVISNTLLLDGTDTSASNRGEQVRLETGGTILIEDAIAETHVNLTFGQVKLEDGTDGAPGLLLSEESEFGPPIEDVIRRAIIDISEDPHNTTESSETTGILLEQAEQGFFKQEDESTVATTYGDDILLEIATTFGVNNKLTLENTRIEVEDETDKVGVIPHQNYLNSTFDNISYSSDIYIDIGMSIPLEDGTDNSGGGNIVFDGTDGSSTDAGSTILHEDGTRASILIDSAFTI
tara:strand:+ start:341 stop:6010 length:5670 start_codon:yes stop_codon:yes gene_type:complete